MIGDSSESHEMIEIHRNVNELQTASHQTRPMKISEFLKTAPPKPTKEEYNDLKQCDQTLYALHLETNVGRSCNSRLNR